MDILYTTTDYYDGPRAGVTRFRGEPHYYQSCWKDLDDSDDVFLLTPISPKIFDAAIEDWNIWLRWSLAFRTGKTTLETHPALPEDRDRHEELKRLLLDSLVTNLAAGVCVTARFDYKYTEHGSEIQSLVEWSTEVKSVRDDRQIDTERQRDR